VNDAGSTERTPLAYFEEMYRQPDPWGYTTSWYEQRKYHLTLASLPRQRYRRCFEPGCSIGVLTAELAGRCDTLVGAEVHEPTAQRARQRLVEAGIANATVESAAIPEWWPPGRFDLIVLSEVAYYFGSSLLDELQIEVAAGLEPDGDLVLVHWTGETDYPSTADEVHERWSADEQFDHLVAHRDTSFRLDVLRRRQARR
jgi:cyclopropane fatty-acyl-phospholipid synthase-like methyltransferase